MGGGWALWSQGPPGCCPPQAPPHKGLCLLRHLLASLFFQVTAAVVFLAYLRAFPDVGFGVLEELESEAADGSPGEERLPDLTVLLWSLEVIPPFWSCARTPGVPTCHFTRDRSRYPQADLVIVQHKDIKKGPKGGLPPEPRPPSQLWVWFNWESPSNSPHLSALDHLFNLTMSYRRDSDIFVPYGWLEVLPRPREVSVPPKSKLAAWVVSNWERGLRRTRYYRQLRRFLPVDLYGIYHRPLPPDAHYPTLSQYKFYLAFENSLHQDYITEKLWKNALEAGSVPVVLGPPRGNYERYLPPEAFIHVEDFPSARELAAFLRKLDRNRTCYERYFQWRRWLKPVANELETPLFCGLCRAFQEKAGRYQRSRELSRWF